ncbi:MAG: hypothetical protein QOC96_713 [Acidobacteriota bacterium]|jgi:hypothetical protein|nr:hypothetical protein [Acidobacteriota bacterium]
MADYIPRPDAEFNTWQDNLVSKLNANPADFNLTAADIAPLTTAQSAWTSAYSGHVAAQAAADAAQKTKQSARGDFESVLRSLVRRIQGDNATTDTHRAQLNISLRETPRISTTGVPDTRPVARIDNSQRQQQTVHFSDEATPNSRAKPADAMGVELWVKIGDPAPTDPSELKFLGLDTQSPYVAHFNGADAGKTAHYMLRWVNSKGEAGPWSQTVSATITG